MVRRPRYMSRILVLAVASVLAAAAAGANAVAGLQARLAPLVAHTPAAATVTVVIESLPQAAGKGTVAGRITRAAVEVAVSETGLSVTAPPELLGRLREISRPASPEPGALGSPPAAGTPTAVPAPVDATRQAPTRRAIRASP
jgi:hypothetical protein